MTERPNSPVPDRRKSDAYEQAAVSTVRRVEWANSLYRLFAGVVATAAVFQLDLDSMLLLASLTLLNLFLMLMAWRGRGPLQGGPKGCWFEVAHTGAAILAIGASLPERTYFEAQGALPFATYGSGTAALFFLLPAARIAGRRAPLAVAEAARVLAVPLAALAGFVGAAVSNGYAGAELPWGFLLLQTSWVVIGGFIGYLVWNLAAAFTTSQLDAVESSQKRFSDWLHSDVKGDLALLGRLIRDEKVDRRIVEEKLNEVGVRVGRERVQLLMSDDSMLVSDLLSHHVERFRSTLVFRQLPAVGGIALPAETARLVDRCLGDLLTNAASASSEVEIYLKIESDTLTLKIVDNGPGFDGSVMNRPTTSLFALKRDLQEAGGTLARREGGRTTMEALIPIRE